MQERDLGVRRKDLGSAVEASLPRPLHQPDDDPHAHIIPPI